MERESSDECSVIFGVDQGELLATKWSFEEFNDIFFAAERKMSCFETKTAKTFQVYCSLWSRKIRF